jgi:hypothetical protein
MKFQVQPSACALLSSTVRQLVCVTWRSQGFY